MPDKMKQKHKSTMKIIEDFLTVAYDLSCVPRPCTVAKATWGASGSAWPWDGRPWHPRRTPEQILLGLRIWGIQHNAKGAKSDSEVSEFFLASWIIFLLR